MQLGEMVAAVVPPQMSGECPFDHEEDVHDRKNIIPPPKTQNNAKTLSSNLDDASLHIPPKPIKLESGKNAMTQFTAHHLVPGNESWPVSNLYRWIDKRKGHVKGDIGYDVNSCRDLPGTAASPGWSGRSASFQSSYAFASMRADTLTRQFHDRHPAYSDFVVQALDKIAAKLDARTGGSAGCGKKNCPGNKAGPKFDPPYNVLDRIYGIAARLSPKLSGSYRSWNAPIITSRFALMYKNRRLTQDAARDLLDVDNFNY
jgi:hypothetical protein